MKEKKELTKEQKRIREEKEMLKNYLGQVYVARKRKRQLENRLRDIQKDVSGPIGGKGYNPLPNHSSMSGDGAASYVYRMAEIEQKIYNQKEAIEIAILKIMDIMDYLPEQSMERMVLELRYIDCMGWKQVGSEVGLTRTPCNEYFQKGLEKLLEFKKVRILAQEYATRQQDV